MQYPSQEHLATPEGLAERFNRPPVHYPVRVLDFGGTLEKDGEFGTPTYTDVEYKVQLCPAPGAPVEIKWMPIAEWRQMVGMTDG